MRIGMFTDTYPPFINGVSTSILMLKNALEKQGHTVFIITVNLKKTKYDYDEKEHVLRIPSLPIHSYDYRVTTVYPIKAIKKIKEMKLDIIHSHVESSIGVFGRVMSKQLGIPLVHTYHTLWEDYTHYITHGNKYLDKTSKEIVKYLTIFFSDKTATELIVPTQKIYKLFKDKYKIKMNIHIVPTGIEIERFFSENIDKKELIKIRKELQLSKKDFVVISLSRLAKEKSVDRLIENHKKILDKCPNIKLLIVGDGPDIDILKKQAKDLKIDKNVIFTGKVPMDKVQYYYNLSSVFATASTTETQGLTVIEAMASSLPVVAINDESFLNSVINELNGFIFEKDEEYVEDIIKLYKNKKMYDSFSKQSKILSSAFSSKYFASRVLDVYEDAIKTFNEKNNKIINKIENIIKKGKDKIWKK